MSQPITFYPFSCTHLNAETGVGCVGGGLTGRESLLTPWYCLIDTLLLFLTWPPGYCPQTRKLSNMNILNPLRSEDLQASILIAFKHVQKQPGAALTAAEELQAELQPKQKFFSSAGFTIPRSCFTVACYETTGECISLKNNHMCWLANWWTTSSPSQSVRCFLLCWNRVAPQFMINKVRLFYSV